MHLQDSRYAWLPGFACLVSRQAQAEKQCVAYVIMPYDPVKKVT